ncbi:MAG: nucleotidyltransferase family protein [Clostridia bacterium]|nr:nucleotidyltransferase family protein [Clostridia bacterium]MBR6523963.1 nucleotidyltransferase family protein [Clostridia bacterium]
MRISLPLYLISILKSLLSKSNFTPPQDAQIDFEALYAFSKAHHLAGFVALCPNILKQMPPELAKKFIYENNRATAREATQEVVISAFLDKMEQAGLRAMPLKGFCIKHFYPHPALRYMTDTDILVDESDVEKINPILNSLGFTFDHETTYEIIYKSPQLVTELHKTLVQDVTKTLYAYYGDGWKFGQKKDGKEFIHEMPLDDLYIYTVSHLAKHYSQGGIGIMHVMDIFVLNRTALDRSYISRELAKLNLEKFEDNIRKLAEMWFSDSPSSEFDDTVKEMAEYILKSGSFGTAENRATAGVSRGSTNNIATAKRKIILQKIFPSPRTIKLLFPITKKYPALYPVFMLVRWFKILFFRTSELKMLSSTAEVSKDKVNTFEEHLNRAGISKNL